MRLVVPFAIACVFGAGCATVSVYEPVTAEISLIDDQSQLQKASDAYSTAAREKGLATGQASFASLADMLSGNQSDANAYWRKIGADKSAPASVVARVREDMTLSVRGLSELDRMAQEMIAKDGPQRDDVTAFETALIHARQSRDSFSDALAQVNRRSDRTYQIGLELSPLDDVLAKARVTADDLAAAHTESVQTAAGG